MKDTSKAFIYLFILTFTTLLKSKIVSVNINGPNQTWNENELFIYFL